MSEISQLREFSTQTGLRRYSIEVSHPKLHKYQHITGPDPRAVQEKARALAAQWDAKWKQQAERERRARSIEEKKNLADERTQAAQATHRELEALLQKAFRLSGYPIAKPKKPQIPDKPASPEIPAEPVRTKPKLGLFSTVADLLQPSRKVEREAIVEKQFSEAHSRWEKEKEEIRGKHKQQILHHQKSIEQLEKEHNDALDTWDKEKEAYLKGDPRAAVNYCSAVLSQSEYPEFVPRDIELHYNPENKVLLVDFQLPAVADIPTLREVRYVQTRDEFDEKHISQSQLNSLYDNVLYQIMLRTLYELFTTDKAMTLASVGINGYVESIDPATGQNTSGCILSVLVTKEEFDKINVFNVEPKACFRALKGVGSSKLHSLTPVAPILNIERTDSRFVDSYTVAGNLDEGVNIAAMDWEDFEHLVREIFEKEFSSPGSEVKVTRASRDGGIDAVVFDPDPLRGGKIVVQAKRYTNAVGVSAVRDLYGTVLNEGANKGVLVTTSVYGPDAYNFAKDKPLVLIDGGNLLHLLEKHGHRAYINLKEAKKMLDEDD